MRRGRGVADMWWITDVDKCRRLRCWGTRGAGEQMPSEQTDFASSHTRRRLLIIPSRTSCTGSSHTTNHPLLNPSLKSSTLAETTLPRSPRPNDRPDRLRIFRRLFPAHPSPPIPLVLFKSLDSPGLDTLYNMHQ